MQINFIAVLVAATIPLLIGAIWFNPKVFGTALAKVSGNPDGEPKRHKPVVYILTFILSLMLAFFIQAMVIHQFHVASLFFKQPIDDPTSEAGALFKGVMDLLGNSYRTFKHGALHGFIGGLTIVTPVMAVNSLFEGRGFKFIAIHAGYWILSMMIMGGIVSAWV